MTLIDLSHVVADGVVTYPGFPPPVIRDWLSWEQSREQYPPGLEFQIGRIEMIANTGTYLDTPAHRHQGGFDLSGLPLEKCAMLPAVVVDGGPEGPIGPEALDGLDVAGAAVLFRTGWDRHWATDAYGDLRHPYITGETAQALVDRGAALVGIDSVNIDGRTGDARPAHTLLLAAGIPIVEHLRGLEDLPPDGFRFSAVPPPITGMGTFPVRAYAVLG